MSKRIKNPFKAKCFRCKFIKCIDFFQISRTDVGGEFYVLYRTVNKKFLPCIAGSCIEVLCKIGAKLKTLGETPQPVSHVLVQTIRDLKCSFFLAIVGHYRNAFQTLRPAVENFLAGMYFQYLESYEDFVKWFGGKYEIPEELYREIFPNGPIKKKKKLDYHFILEFLVKEIINSKWKGWIEERIGMLNRYLHPNFQCFDRSRECVSCPAIVEYSEENLLNFVRLFQEIVWFIMMCLFEMFSFEEFEKDENVKEAIEMLTIQPEIVPEFVKSEQYRSLLISIRERWKEITAERKENQVHATNTTQKKGSK